MILSNLPNFFFERKYFEIFSNVGESPLVPEKSGGVTSAHPTLHGNATEIAGMQTALKDCLAARG